MIREHFHDNTIDVRQTAGANLKLVKNVYIHPLSLRRQIWNIVVTTCLVYNGIVIPMRIAFDLVEDTGAFAFDRVIDAIFIFDILINFETGITLDDSEGAIMERKQVYRNYLSSWFPLDFISSVPLEIVLQYGFGVNASSETRAPKLLRSLIRLILKSARMTRMVKSFRMLRLFNNFEERSLVGLDSADLIRFIVFIVFLLHWSACIFFYLDNNVCLDSPERSIFYNLDMEFLPFMDKYVASIYWAFATVLTIGYGDISGICTATRVFSMFVMLIGSAGYAYGISMVMGMMQKRREINREFKELMSSVESYAKFRNLPIHLKMGIKEYFTFINARNEFINEKIIMDQLTPELRKLVLHHVNHELIQTVHFFRELQAFENSLNIEPKTLLVEIISAMETQVLRPGEMVLSEGDAHDSLYLITKGSVSSYKWTRLKIDTLTDGDSFGEACFLARSLTKNGRGADYRMSQSHLMIEKLLHLGENNADGISSEEVSAGELMRGTSIASISAENNTGGSIKDHNYFQPYTIIANTYTDIRYITRDAFDNILKKYLRQKRLKIQSFMKRRCEKMICEIAEFEDDLRDRFPEVWESFVAELTRISAEQLSGTGPEEMHSQGSPEKGNFIRRMTVGGTREANVSNHNEAGGCDDPLSEESALITHWKSIKKRVSDAVSIIPEQFHSKPYEDILNDDAMDEEDRQQMNTDENVTSGCTETAVPKGEVVTTGENQNVIHERSSIETGTESSLSRLFGHIKSGESISPVTDEALFHPNRSRSIVSPSPFGHHNLVLPISSTVYPDETTLSREESGRQTGTSDLVGNDKCLDITDVMVSEGIISASSARRSFSYGLKTGFKHQNADLIPLQMALDARDRAPTRSVSSGDHDFPISNRSDILTPTVFVEEGPEQKWEHHKLESVVSTEEENEDSTGLPSPQVRRKSELFDETKEALQRNVEMVATTSGTIGQNKTTSFSPLSGPKPLKTTSNESDV